MTPSATSLTRSAVTRSALPREPKVTPLSSAVESLCGTEGKRGHAVRCLLWLLTTVQSKARQTLNKGLTYFELCPAYLATVEGVTRWSAAEGWRMLRQAVQWPEVTSRQAVQLGADLRKLKSDRRRGRNILITPEIMADLRGAFNRIVRKGANLPLNGNKGQAGCHDPIAVVKCRKWRDMGGNFTEKTNCPMKSAHKHGDRRPSLVLWRNSDGLTGGALCMTCRAKFRVKFDPSGRAELFKPVGNDKPAAPSFAPDLHNRKPYRSKIEPVGGQVVPFKGQGSVHTANLKTSETGLCRSSRSVPRRTARDLLEVLQRADMRASRASSADRAAERFYLSQGSGFERTEIPDRIVSMSDLTVTEWLNLNGGRKMPAKFKPYRQRFVLFDIDHLTGSEEQVRRAAALIKAVVSADSELSGRHAVIQTSDQGVQVMAELREARSNPREWFRHPDVQEWYKNAGRRVLKACRSAGMQGGKVDRSACAAGRFARLPSWRVTKSDKLFRSWLVSSCQERCKKPRYVKKNRADATTRTGRGCASGFDSVEEVEDRQLLKVVQRIPCPFIQGR